MLTISIYTFLTIIVLFVLTEEICEYYNNGNLGTYTNENENLSSLYEPKIDKNNVQTIRELLDIFPGHVKWRLIVIISFIATTVFTFLFDHVTNVATTIFIFASIFLILTMYSSYGTYHIYGPVAKRIQTNLNFIENNQLVLK